MTNYILMRQRGDNERLLIKDSFKILSIDLQVLRKQGWVNGLKYIEPFTITTSLGYELSAEYNESKKQHIGFRKI